MKAKTRILMLLLVVLVLTTTLLPTTAFADSSIKITKSNAINSNYYYWGGQMIQYTFTYADGTTITTNHGGFALHYAGENLTSIVGAQVAYCIEPDTGSTTGTTYSGTAAENSAYWNNKLSPAQREAIKLIMLYGAPNGLQSNDANTLFGYEGATQILIWEIVMGLRSPYAPYTLNDSRMKNNFYSNSAFPSTKTGYDTIVQKMQNHLTVPSFSSTYQNTAPTHTLTYDAASGLFKTTLTDSRGVLSQDYTFTATGVTFSKSGNTLYVSAPASAFANGDVLASATGRSLNVDSIGQMIWTLPGKQTVTTFTASPDPVKAYFKLKLPTTSLGIVKQSSDGNVSNITFTVTDSAGHTLFTGKTNSQGKLNVPNLAVGQTITVTETVPDNYVADQRTQTITLTAGTNSLTFKNYPKGTMTIRKTSDEGDVEGYCFKLYQWSVNKSWYGKSDASGNVYVTDQNYAASGTKVYTFNGLTDGKYTIVEVLSKHGKDEVFPDSIRITITNKGSTKYDHTFTGAELEADSNGDCRINQVQLTGLSDGGVMSITVHNKPTDAPVEIVKTSVDGVVEGISFKVEQYEPDGGIGWWEMGTFQTDSSGKIQLDPLPIGTKLRITEIVPTDYICLSQNPQTITVEADGNRVSFENKPVSRLELIKTSDDGNVKGLTFTIEEYEPEGGIGWWTVGTYQTNKSGKINVDLKYGYRYRVTETVPEDYVCENRVQEFTAKKGANILRFANHPVSRLEIIKTADDGNVKGITFTVEEYEPDGGIGWWTMGTYQTDRNGKINADIKYGYQYRVTETVPEDYVCENRVQEFTAVKGTNTVSFHNRPVATLEIVKTSTDGRVSGISFQVEEQVSGEWRLLDTYISDENGKIHVEGLEVGKQLRITEVVPENYICTTKNPKTVTLVKGTNSVSFTNKPIVTLELLKTSDDGKVAGIEFTLERKGKNNTWSVLDTYVTDEDGRIVVEDLKEGATYRLTETVPEGYIGETPVQEFTAALGTNEVNFSNRLIRGDLRIVKVDKATQTPLQGAGYRVFNAAGEVVAEDYTDENGEVSFEQLAYGEYTYQEFEAPEGFVLDDTVYSFSILQDGEEIVKQHDNQPKEGSITIYKVDEAGRPLPGVTFLLEFSVDGGRTWSPIQYREPTDDVQAGYCTSEGLNEGKLVTGNDGYAVFTGLCIDTQLGEVRYRVTETATKNGYSLLADYAFNGTLSEDAEIEVSFTVVNQPEFKMPATGGSGFVGTAVAVSLAGIAAAALFLALTKKRRTTAE